MNNGVHPNGDEGNVDDLARAYRDLRLQFRHHPDCKIPFMKWQAGRTFPDERFELVAYAATSYALCERLADLPDDPPVTSNELKQRIVAQMKEHQMTLEDAGDGRVRAVWRENGEWMTGLADLERLGRHVGVLGPSEHLAGHAPTA
jgi:hypothetical protein